MLKKHLARRRVPRKQRPPTNPVVGRSQSRKATCLCLQTGNPAPACLGFFEDQSQDYFAGECQDSNPDMSNPKAANPNTSTASLNGLGHLSRLVYLVVSKAPEG